MKRRTLVVSGMGVLASAAGCTGILGDSDGGSGPGDTVKAYWEAIFEFDAEEANSYLHPDSDIEPVEEPSEDEDPPDDFSVNDVEVIEESENSATVEITIRGDFSGSGEIESLDLRYSLRKDDGEWLVYENVTESDQFGGGGPSPPSSVWETSERTDDSGNTTAVIFEHDGGDTIQSDSIEFRVDNLIARPPNDDQEIVTGTRLVVPFEQSGASIDESSEVTLIWQGSDSAQILATHTLGNATTGTLGSNFTVESR